MKIKNLEDAEAFCEVARQQSFSRAADVLGLPISTVSKRVSKLEETLGVSLIHRSTRSMHLTDEGARLFPLLQRLFGDVLELEDILAESAIPQGTVRVTAPLVLAKLPFARILASFSRLYPRVQIALDFSDEFQGLVEDGFDIAIRLSNLEDSRLVRRRLGPNRLKMVCSPAYARSKCLPKTVSDLRSHPVFIIPAHSRRKFLSSGVELGELAANAFIHTNSGQFALEMARLDMGIAVRSHWDVAEEIAAGDLVEIELDDKLEPSNDAYIITPSNRYMSSRVRLLMDYLIEELPLHLQGALS